GPSRAPWCVQGREAARWRRYGRSLSRQGEGRFRRGNQEAQDVSRARTPSAIPARGRGGDEGRGEEYCAGYRLGREATVHCLRACEGSHVGEGDRPPASGRPAVVCPEAGGHV